MNPPKHQELTQRLFVNVSAIHGIARLLALVQGGYGIQERSSVDQSRSVTFGAENAVSTGGSAFTRQASLLGN